MADYALLNNVDHRDVKIATERAARFGDQVMKAPVFPFEFRNVQAFYPILFQRDASGVHAPVALFGFQEGENLFLSETGWDAAYVPAMLRRAPFLIGFQDATVEGKPERIRVLSLDMAHPRVRAEDGEALFEPLGARTPFLERMADLLEALHEGIAHNRAFVKALGEHDLLEAVTFEITLNDGSTTQLLGFDCINEEKVQALSGETLGEFNEKQLLAPLFMALASMANVARLVERKNQRVGGATPPDLGARLGNSNP